ncbi:MAG: GEVED domain-containing protein, partial [Halobacteriales archaeon]|nr:GEVED domain-containing protein [Halobacteriales archaeon]
QSTKPWNLHAFGSNLDGWRAPYDTQNPKTDPANNPNTVIGLDGYPAPTDSGDLSLGPPITFDDDHEYEWPMVYEWSLNVGSGGTGCSDNQLFLITGASHHSPMKEGVAGLYDEECGEENDCFPPGDDENNPLSDYGDLPDSYSTLEASNGPQHYIVVDAPYMGQTVAIETDGQPSPFATDDGDEEDGVSPVVIDNWEADDTETFDVQISNAPNGAVLAGWFDWNRDGDFDDADEFATLNVSNSGTHSLQVTVGSDFDGQQHDLFTRFRLFSSASAAPGGSLDQSDYGGVATDGEVEDHYYQAGTLPVTLSSFSSDGVSGGELTVRWQTASETDNVGFELRGLVDGEWKVLSDLVPTRGMNSALPQSYELEVEAPAGLSELRLVSYDSRGRTDQFGPFGLHTRFGERQPEDRVDWSGPRAERTERLRQRGFADVSRSEPPSSTRSVLRPADGAGAFDARPSGLRSKAGVEDPPAPQWKKLARETVRPTEVGAFTNEMVFDTGRSRDGDRGRDGHGTEGLLETGPLTHVAVTEPGIQRVTYEDLRDGGLDLTGVVGREIAVTWRGEPVPRWIDGSGRFGPGSAIEFLGQPPRGDDALYIDSALYQISVDPTLVREATTIGKGKVRWPSEGYWRESVVDRPRKYHSQSPTGDPWIERWVVATSGSPTTVSLDLPVEGSILEASPRLMLSLGTITDLQPLTGGDGALLDEHHVEVSVNGFPVTSSSTSGQRHWRIESELPDGVLKPGSNEVRLRFSTPYLYSLVVIDHFGVRYLAPYQGPVIDFAPDSDADGYWIEGFS